MKKNLKYIYILLFSIFIGIIPIKAETNGIILNKSKTTLGIGYSETLKYSLGNVLNSSNIVWHSSNDKIAKVDSNGKITGITEGTTIITASINGYSSTCIVNVSSSYVAVNGISLNKSNLNILVGTEETLTKTITPSNATNKDVMWSSSDLSVATIDQNGKVTAKKVGTAIITVSASGYSSTCVVNVVNNVVLKGISLNKSNLTIKEESSETLSIIYNPNNATNKKITWKSSNTNVAIVNSNGKVTGKKAGNATITAISNDGGYVASCKVTVESISKNVTSISLDKKEMTIMAGEKSLLKVTINPSYAENKNVIWESSNEKVATVENGNITAVSVGTAEIKVISEDGNKEAICKVTVTSPPIKSISFKEEKQTIFLGDEVTLITISEPINSIIENPIWNSSNKNVAIVENGIVKALSIGETTITISNQDNTITASTNITVINKPKEKLNITIEGYNLNFDPNIKNYTLKIGNESELTINTNTNNEKVNINGNKNLKNGSIITITITDEEKVTYVIEIKKKENYTIYFIAIISVLLLLNLIRIIVNNKKKSK